MSAWEQLISTRAIFKQHAEQFFAGEDSEDALRWAAWGYWRQWPAFLDTTLFLVTEASKENLDPMPEHYDLFMRNDGYEVRDMLACAHEGAVALLMREAECRGIDSTQLSKVKPIVRGMILERSVRKPWPTKSGLWPDLLGDHLYEFPAQKSAAIQDSTAAFDRLLSVLPPLDSPKLGALYGWKRMFKSDSKQRYGVGWDALKKRNGFRYREIAGTREVEIHPDDWKELPSDKSD